MTGRVEGKIALVTGGAMGLGKADALMLAAEGATVVVADIDETEGRATAAALAREGMFLRLNVTSEEDWIAVMGEIERRYGRLDILVNNAGVATTVSVEDCTLAEWRRVHAVSADGTFLGCKYAIALMKRHGGGSIINMASIASQVGIAQVAAYCGAKGSVRSFTKSVAAHCAQRKYNIRCNSVHPSGIDTPMGRAARAALYTKDAAKGNAPPLADSAAGTPDDVAYMVLYLASDEARWVNGTEMLIDNGITATPGLGR